MPVISLHHRSLQRVGLLVALVVPLLTACGGGSDDPVEPPAPPPPATGQATPASTTRLSVTVGGLALAPSGEVVIADTGNKLIRKLTANYQQVSTLASAETDARISNPAGVAVDAAGNTYVADSGTHLVLKISATGAITTLAGQAGICGIQDGVATAATLCGPSSVAVDKAGTVYVSQRSGPTNTSGPNTSGRIRKITADGTVSTFVSATSQYLQQAFNEGPYLYSSNVLLATDSEGTLYAADPNDHVIRKYAANGAATVVSGTAGIDRSVVDGAASVARFASAQAITFDRLDRLYVQDRDSRNQDISIRRVASDGSVTTLVRTPLPCGATNSGPGSLCSARNMVAAADGQLLVAEYGGVGTPDVHMQLRSYPPQGNTSTVVIGGGL
ncbi:hypothetical protein [Acidovorax sp. Root217]|uniref:NHL domain-containing protein n=1 Tax=Acidovorax sp. Root217 TaxID=1736492 RepID=UPI00071456B2|nr:hypothetical protein [Acidovorax sp. Root217]KRC21960.1 hypothetical protein ASE31_23000 [Acidovorax sp. Root217]